VQYLGTSPLFCFSSLLNSRPVSYPDPVPRPLARILQYAFTLCANRQNLEIPTQALPGSSFVDIGLKVVVHQARGTVMAFQPEHLHGTTIAHGAINTGMSISFSRCVSEAWKDAEELNGKFRSAVKLGL